jgi:hypothetical protein
MNIRASELAAAIAERINRALPEGFAVHAEQSVLRIRSSTRWHVNTDVDLRDFFDGIGGELDLSEVDVPRDYVFGRMALAVEQFLSTLQDDVSEELTIPWPPDITSTRLAMAMPFVEIDGKVLRSGFGQPDRLTIEFEPIELTGFLR